MRELAERVVAAAGRLFGYTGKVVMQASPDADYLVDNPNRRCPIITKARDHLGYDPQIAFEDGLDRALLWYRDHQDAAPEPWASTTSPGTGAAA